VLETQKTVTRKFCRAEVCTIRDVKLDHLVVAASDLQTGTAWLEEALGVRLQPGGQHAFMGTHNRLLRLGDAYLEIIAVDPNAPAPNRPRWFNLDALQSSLETPRLIHWVVSGDIERAVKSTEELGEIKEVARGDLKWRITIPADGHLPGDGLIPTVIQWDGERPVTRLPESGCALVSLRASHPEPQRIGAALEVLGVELSIATGTRAAMRAVISCPNGLVTLD
jgi:Glyoxalase-like domain